MPWLDRIFKAHAVQEEGGLYLIELMSAAVLLICTEWGTTEQHSPQWEAIGSPLSSSFLSFRQDTEQLFATSNKCICFLLHPRLKAMENAFLHLCLLSVFNFLGLVISKSQRKLIIGDRSHLCQVYILTGGPSSSNNRYNWHSEKGTREHTYCLKILKRIGCAP